LLLEKWLNVTVSWNGLARRLLTTVAIWFMRKAPSLPVEVGRLLLVSH